MRRRGHLSATLVASSSLLVVEGMRMSMSVESLQANPIRKVVTLLQELAEEIEAERDEALKVHEKVQCGCKKEIPDMGNEIEDAQNSISALQSQISERSGAAEQLNSELAALEKDIAENKQSLAEAEEVRKKESEEYQSEAAVTRVNIAAMDQAIPALRAGLTSAFLQKQAKTGLTTLLQNGAFAAESDREAVYQVLRKGSAFLQVDTASSGEIVGILEQMRSNMQDNLIESTKQEEDARATFDKLEGSKKGEIAAASKELTEKSTRKAKQESDKATAEENLADTEKALEDTQKDLADKKKACADESALYDENEKARQEEILGVQEAIKILNSDDSLRPFDKAMPAKEEEASAEAAEEATSFVQVEARGKFDALLKKCNDMISLLQKEQKSEDDERDKCNKDLAQSALDVKDAETVQSTAGQAVEQKNAEVSAVKDEVASVKSVLAELETTITDEGVARKAENAAFVQEQSELSAAVKLLQKAAKKLKETFGAKKKSAMQVAASSSAVEGSSSSDAVAMGQPQDAEVSAMLGLEEAPSSFLQESQSPRSQKGGNIVIILINMAADVKREIALLEQQENEEQKDYDALMADLAKTRQQRKDELTTKNATLAKLKQEAEELAEDLSLAEEDATQQREEEQTLHSNCDDLLKNYGTRKDERAGAVDGLRNAIAILKGMTGTGAAAEIQTSTAVVQKAMSVRPELMGRQSGADE
ncbi:unnamed protein product [Amoebophrya sp. A25]|nr:unnamed protein product [Amoebophrya sp. A25]|eukprot:GSA25T00010342001.1